MRGITLKILVNTFVPLIRFQQHRGVLELNVCSDRLHTVFDNRLRYFVHSLCSIHLHYPGRTIGYCRKDVTRRHDLGCEINIGNVIILCYPSRLELRVQYMNFLNGKLVGQHLIQHLNYRLSHLPIRHVVPHQMSPPIISDVRWSSPAIQV